LGKRSTGTKRPSSNADTTARESPVLKQPVMGYAANKAQRDRLLEAGYLRVWTLGDGAESLKAAIAYARGRAGTLAICTEDGRVFGDTRKQVEAAMGMIEAAGLRIHDLDHPDDKLLTDHSARAQASAAGSGRFHDKRQQRRVASKGGKAAGAIKAAQRQEIASDEVLRRLVAHPKLTYRDVQEITGIGIATLKRRYGT
jgi:hypothetical protein